MSTSLPEDAPKDSDAAQAPADDEAADDDSVDSTEEVIPKERFNGLQRKYQTDKSAWDVEREALGAEVERLRQQAAEESSVSDNELLDEVRALRAENAAIQMEAARQRAIAKFPGAAPLADLIVGRTPDEIEAMAETLQTRLAGLTATGASSDDSGDAGASGDENSDDAADSGAASGGAPQLGGAASFDDSQSVDDDIAAAVESRDFTAFLRATEQRAARSQGTDLTVG